MTAVSAGKLVSTFQVNLYFIVKAGPCAAKKQLEASKCERMS